MTDEERRHARDPFASWGGYVEATSDPRTRFYTRANLHNDYLRDRALEKELMLGIPFLVNLQDRAMTETMGPIYDRTQEHLETDAIDLHAPPLLGRPRACEQGEVPANVDAASLYRGVRVILLPECESWITATGTNMQADAASIALVPFV